MDASVHNAETFAAGDVIVICDDDPIASVLQPPTSGESGNVITYQGDGDSTAEFSNCTGHCINIGQQVYLTIQNLKIDTAVDYGIIRSDDGATWADYDQAHIVIDNVEISGVVDTGIFMKGDHLTVSNSTLTDNGDTSSAYHNVYLIGDNLTVSGNSLTDAPEGCGLRIYGSDIDILRNTITGNATRAICVQLDTSGLTHQTWTIAYNLITQTVDDYFIQFQNGAATSVYSGISLYNNTFYNPTAGADAFYINDMTDFTFRNNIVVIDDYGMGLISSTGTTNITNNMYHGADRYYETADRTWAAWTGLGYDANSTEDDPEFVSAGTDFNLQSTSPAINTGVDVSLTTDYNGQSLDGLPDIGAMEYQTQIKSTGIYGNFSIGN